MTPTEAEDLADASFVAAVADHARWASPSECVHEAGLQLLTGPNDRAMTFRNSMVRTDPRRTAAEALAHARAFYGARGRGFSTIVRVARDADLEADLRAAGLEPASDAPCMLTLARVPVPATPAGVRVERIATPRHLDDFVGVVADAYAQLGLAPQETHLFFSRAEALLSGSPRFQCNK